MKKKHLLRIRNNRLVLDRCEFGDFRDHMFIEELPEEVMKNSEDIKHILEKTRKFRAIKCGTAYLSVQANECMYCIPRETLKDIRDYRAMEIAIFIKNSKFATFKECGIKDIDEEIDQVGAYIDVDTIQYVYGRLCRKFKEVRDERNGESIRKFFKEK